MCSVERKSTRGRQSRAWEMKKKDTTRRGKRKREQDGGNERGREVKKDRERERERARDGERERGIQESEEDNEIESAHA